MSESHVNPDTDEQSAPDQDGQDGQDGTRNSVLEWFVAGLGLCLVVGAVGFMIVQAVSSQDRPPNVQLRVVSVAPSSGGYLVLIEARNGGDEAAAELGVEGTVARGDQPPETSDTTFDFLPAASVREGGLFFTEDPRGALTLRVLGYREP